MATPAHRLDERHGTNGAFVTTEPSGCIFCGSRPLTREHIYPRWLSRVLWKRLPVNIRTGGIRFGLGTDQTQQSPLQSQGEITTRSLVHPRELSVVARCVCADCNHGWMREIEDAAAEHMIPMILGDPSEYDLTPEVQDALSAWIALRAMVIPYAHPAQEPVRNDWLRWMYEEHSPPPGWRVWAAAYVGRVPTSYEVRKITAQRSSRFGKRPDNPAIFHGLTADFQTGYLALKVVGLDRFPFKNPRSDFMLRMRPSPGITFRWPPRYVLTDETIEQYLVMFLPDGATSPNRRHFQPD